MLNKVLWTLDNETDADGFERLCVDLLYRNGYHDIIPIGRRKDRGRDAEVDRRRTPIFIAPSGEKTFFQFSLADRWEKKLQKELAKVKQNGHDIDAYLFVSTASITGTRTDQLSKIVSEEYGWRLEIREREWLRLQLEEVHPDLAERHLGIPQAHQQASATTIDLPPLAGKSDAAKLFNDGRYAAAAVALTEWLTVHSDDGTSWCALASCHYQQRHYADALSAIQEAISLQPHNLYTQRTHASILVEKGIHEHERASILRGRDIFTDIARTSHTWTDAYNLANSLIALNDYEGARSAYQQAIERDANQPQAWKNLGSAHERLGDLEKAFDCYDKALAIDANLPEALFAKATLLIKRGEARDGAELIERVFATHAAARTHWNATWWWLAEAYRLDGKPIEALCSAGRALAQFPSNERLLDMKAHLLSEQWHVHADLQREAEGFFKFRAELTPDDYRPVESLTRIYIKTNRVEEAWMLVDRFLRNPSASVALRDLSPLDDVRLKSLRYARSYRRFRGQQPIADYSMRFQTDGLVFTEEYTQKLYWSFLDPFAEGWQEANASVDRTEESYMTFSEHHAPRIRAALAQWAESISLKLLAPPRENQAKALTLMLLNCPMIALLECSRQTGFLAGYFSFEIDPQTMPIPQAVANIQRDVFDDVLLALNRRTNLFPPEKKVVQEPTSSATTVATGNP
jgi:tetratricopeptide (TPR) repeat protein